MGKVLDVLAPRNLELGPAGSAEQSPWRHWRLARDENGVAWLVLDKAGASANTLSEDVLIELDDVLAKLERDPPKGLVLRSAKPGGFIAGADIGEFRGMTDATEVEVRLTRGNAIVDRLDRLTVPTRRRHPRLLPRRRARDRARLRLAGSRSRTRASASPR